MFNRIFWGEYNIFFVPTKNQRNLSKSFKNVDEESLLAAYNSHQKEISIKEKENDKINPNCAHVAEVRLRRFIATLKLTALMLP